MASRHDKRVTDATTKLGRTIARALRSWAKEVGADDIASEVVDRVREGLDVVRDRTNEAVGKARTKARRTAKKARSVAKRKTTRKKTTKKKAVRKKK